MSATIALRRNAEISYPALTDHSPDTLFPEYPFQHNRGNNRVYAMVRDCLHDAGCDRIRFGTSSWNPLSEWIQPGSRVFVLPNFVVDRRRGERIDDFYSKCTHAAVLRPVLDYAIIGSGNPQLVSFGNSSLQSCDYDRVAEDSGAKALGEFYRDVSGTTLGPVDLRAVVTQWTPFGALVGYSEQNREDVVNVDLGAASLLDEFYRDGSRPQLRVTDYDQREMADYHGVGKHIYAVNRRVLEADTLISVPKLKTHEKVGITCALKGTVGSIARKECLAHHRKGSPANNGDEYPRSTPLHNFASALADRVTTLGSDLPANALRVTSKLLYRSLRLGPSGIMAGSWYGNDTAWRMALDIARVLRFARTDGTLANTPQRKHLVVVDGIIGGEGEGPVYPQARHAGIVIFGSDPAWTDYACATAMCFNPTAIPLIAAAVCEMPLPVTDGRISDIRIAVNGAPGDFASIADTLPEGFRPPKGWTGHVEARGD